ncbi:MAG: superoxide dismutase [Oscillospiraceae bacterium]
MFFTETYKFENPSLPYGYSSLEPFIDELTMQIHHDRHLQTYTDNLNAALAAQPELQTMGLEELLLEAGKLPASLGTPIARNAGGVYNHRFFFEGMSPTPQKAPTGALAAALDRDLGGLDGFLRDFRAAALGVFGSGYAWLVSDPKGALRIIGTANQDTPLTLGLRPLLCLDVWEHAYYLKHYNKRADYITDWLSLANWHLADTLYSAVK